MSYHGDITLGDTIDIKFTTRRFSTGAPFTLAGTPVISAYVDNGTTQITAGITLTVDFDSVTGLNNVRVVASGGNGYTTATEVQLVITTGTVDSVSVVGEVVGSFSIAKRPVDVTRISGDSTAADNAEAFFDGTGYAGTNNVIPTVTTVTTATNVTTVNGLAANVITATSIASDAITAAKIADGAIDAATFAAGAIDAAAMNVTGSEFTAIPWNAAWDAEVQSEVQDAIEANRLDELLNADSDIDGAAPPTVGSVFHELMTKTTGSFTFDQTTDSLEAVRDRGDAAWITATGFSTHTAAQVRAEIDSNSTQLAAIVADTNELQADWANGGRLDLLIDGIIADLPQRITKNTALAAFPFLMVDATDLVTPETGLTVTATRSLDGAAFGACANAVSEIGTGWYKIDLAAGDLNGNTVALKFTATGAATRNITLITQPT